MTDSSRVAALLGRPEVRRDRGRKLDEEAARGFLKASGEPVLSSALSLEREAGGVSAGDLTLGLRSRELIPRAWEKVFPGGDGRGSVVLIGLRWGPKIGRTVWLDADGGIWEEPGLDHALPVASGWVDYVESLLDEPDRDPWHAVHRWRGAVAGRSADELCAVAGLPIAAPRFRMPVVWPPPLSSLYASLNDMVDGPMISAPDDEAFWQIARRATEGASCLRLDTALPNDHRAKRPSPPDAEVLLDVPFAQERFEPEGRLQVVRAGQSWQWWTE